MHAGKSLSVYYTKVCRVTVRRYDVNRDNYIDMMELKLMMEKLGQPQTHLGLKNMMKEVDEDLDNRLSFREVRDVCEALLPQRGVAWRDLLPPPSAPVPAHLQEGGGGGTGGQRAVRAGRALRDRRVLGGSQRSQVLLRS